ncbi:MAG TPA: 2,3-bisphosphoglycerate-dependent phosphoglycerate mutase, partial [Allocoleopsis sp.]
MAELVIIRHGESVWNMENRFTGAMDVPLSKKGKEEAKRAGEHLKGYNFDVVFVSHLIRAMDTLYIMLEHMSENRTPIIYHYDDHHLLTKEHSCIDPHSELRIIQSRALDERYYGDLQGMNKDEARKKFGEEQVHIWRRSFDVNPPGGESLKDTIRRVMPFYERYIVPELKKGRKVLIAAHGNSLRALVKHLEKVPDNEIPNYELETGVPIVYDLDEHLHVVSKKVL